MPKVVATAAGAHGPRGFADAGHHQAPSSPSGARFLGIWDVSLGGSSKKSRRSLRLRSTQTPGPDAPVERAEPPDYKDESSILLVVVAPLRIRDVVRNSWAVLQQLVSENCFEVDLDFR